MLLIGIVLLAGLSACASAAPEEASEPFMGEAEFLDADESVAAVPPAPAEDPMMMEEADFAAADSGVGGNVQGTVPQERLIIRTADIALIVDDTLATIDDIGQMASAMGGFVVTSNSYQSGFESSYYGSISIRVPADRFDDALSTLKQMAVEVTNESISGQDVTEEFVDLEARIANLKVAEEQLQEIMDNAQDTEDVLSVYNQLIQIRGEIEVLEGRKKYLSESARLSTINVSLEPNIITQPVDVRWKPLETVKESLEDLGRTMAGVGNFLIRFIIVILPALLVIVAVFAAILSPFYFIGRGILRRRRARKAAAAADTVAVAEES
jgi:hypothetical protein